MYDISCLTYNNVGYLTHVVSSFGYFFSTLLECENHPLLSFVLVVVVFECNHMGLQHIRHPSQNLSFKNSIKALLFYFYFFAN